GVLLVFGFLRGETAAVDGAEQAVPPGVDHTADRTGLAIALAPTTRGLAAIWPAGVALTQLLDTRELLGRVGGGEEAILDAAALSVRPARYSGVGDAVAAGDGRRMLSRGEMLKAGPFYCCVLV
ncbi:MAG: hypothetical protein MR595_06420, partial [Collinsella sp.]|nr:hypothetical protein [Collinsella sp.]